MITLAQLIGAISPNCLIGTPILTAAQAEAPVAVMSPVSRKTGADSLFVCIRGAVQDGHTYAERAYLQGCRAFVAERPLDLPDDAAVITVSDSRAALAQMAKELCS